MFMRYSIKHLYIFIMWNAYRLIDESTTSYIFALLKQIYCLKYTMNPTATIPAAKLPKAYIPVQLKCCTYILINIFSFPIHSLPM